MYSPPRSESAFRSARDRLEEELRFVSRMAGLLLSSLSAEWLIFQPTNPQILNVCVTMNEFPFIRYYLPTHHAPLGPLKPNDTTRAPPPPENSGRWRTQLARGAEARAYENADTDFVSKVLAFMVQRELDEYKKANPDFPVGIV